MGIVNVTPDSFSDAGESFVHIDAIARGRELTEQGADIIDVGGESTRPGATPVDPEEEARRITPVVKALVDAGAVVSIDTRHASVMQAAVGCGAKIINDVSALTDDPRSLEVAAASSADIVLMHRTVEIVPYDDVTGAVIDYLDARIDACVAAGIARERLALDPGFGFGKRLRDNERLLSELARLKRLGCPILVGLSRKFGKGKAPKDRLTESLAMAKQAIEQGAAIVRVHDVAETVAFLQESHGNGTK
jgi:dihydropteroate synthase